MAVRGIGRSAWATSTDGLRFTKHPGNPVMTHLPNNGEEEGANSAGVYIDAAGQFAMHYGAATQIGADTISADGRVAVSNDGLSFADLGAVVLDHGNSALYGSGDEIFPLAGYNQQGQHYVFYVPNGVAESRDVAVAWGPSVTSLPFSAQVVDGDDRNPAHLAANVIELTPDQILLFVQRGWWPNIRVELRTAHPARPDELSEPLAVYDTPIWNEHTKFFTVFLDRETDTWLLYRSNWDDQIVVHTAPAL